ncbi:MAG: HAD-IA family hydrolase [Solirubrobacterales bacterium]
MAQQIPKNISFVTFDCYGALIDWEKGAIDAFRKEAERDGFTFDEQELLGHFRSIQREVMTGSYELYAEVLRRTAVKTAEELGWELEPSRAQFLPDSIAWWPPHRDANAALDRIKKKFELGIVSNVDDKLLGVSRRHLRADLDIVVTAQQVRSYKPDGAHFKECARRMGGKKGWVHIGSDYDNDVEPLLKMKVPVIWLNRKGEDLGKRRKPSVEAKTLKEATNALGLK